MIFIGRTFVNLFFAIFDAFVKVVTPLKNGVQRFHKCLRTLDSGFRRNDGKRAFSTFYETIMNWNLTMSTVKLADG